MKKIFWCPIFALSLGLLLASNSSSQNNAGTIFGAAMDGRVDMVRAYLDKGAPVNAKDEDGHTLLMYAALFGRSEVVKLLVERGADVSPKDKDGDTVLMYAVKKGDPETVRLLLGKHPDLNAKDNNTGLTALGFAEKGGSIEVIRLLKAAGVKTSFAGQLSNELQDALLMNDVNRIRTLLDQGADIEAKFVMGWTPLIRASEEGRADIVRLLLSKGADVNARGDSMETALGCAALAGQADVVRILVENDADINAKDHSGLSPLGSAEAQLKIAVDRGYTEDIKGLAEVIRILKAAGAK
jgi:ankyrin repeat protein